ncbi:SulP family inorganic anion transporter [Piscinibacter sp. XHJ-5]|uniref:SulP family inorganic anion transporter n=1 Tax=Piscinibacter sp. XHJ-5 TaxID=3037797 RepID=UPI00245354A7|nr:SulP family inorganic anion transporter [Piscinibacter sp. XHJ-5]
MGDALGEDLLAAVVVGVLLIPQSLAYALLAGLPPQAGLYASLLPLIAYAAFGSSRVMGVGPVAVLALMISQALADAPAGVAPHDAALVLAAEVAVLLALAAGWRLDALAALLSVPVLQGFETGAALSIALSQLPVLLGSSAHGSSLLQVIDSWRHAAVPWWPLTAVYGVAALVALWLAKAPLLRGLERLMPAWRAQAMTRLAPLGVLLAAIGVAAATQAGGRGVDLVGSLPSLEWPLGWPPLDLALWRELLPSAALIALVCFVSSLVVAESLARHDGMRIDPRRELAGLAAANAAAAIGGGMPVAGSFTRSVVNRQAGARTRMAGVFTALWMALAILVLARPLALLPTAVLAATILAAVAAVFDVRPFREAWRYSRVEGALMAVVAGLTLVQGVAWALAVGVAGSIALLLQRTARPHVALIGRVPGTEHYRNVGRHQVELTPGVLGLRIDESLLFINARQLADVVQQQLAGHPETRRIVLLMSPVNRIDFSGLTALRALHELLRARGIRLDLSEVKGPVLDGLRDGGWSAWFDGKVFLSHHQAMHEDG